jgi:tetratricopeptide (TPR) repeat protein
MPVNLSARFQAGLDLALASAHDRASEIFAECVAADPADPEFAAAFLSSLESVAAGTMPALPYDQELPADFQQARQQKQWAAVWKSGAEFLVKYPGHLPALCALAEASAASGQHDIELRYLDTAARLAPDSIEVHRQRAKAQMRLGQVSAAMEAWGRVQDAAPDDAEATAMLASLAIAHSRQRNGMELAQQRGLNVTVRKPPVSESGLKPIVYHDDRMVRDILRQADEHRRTPIQQLEVALRDHTSNPDLYLKLATLYMEKGRDYDAEKLLVRAKEMCDDVRIAECWEDVTMIRLDRKVSATQRTLEGDDNAANQAALAEARKGRDRFQTEVFLNRCKREPNNAELRLELGRRHKQAGKMRDAYECFTVALNDLAYKAPAACEMADCLERAGRIVEALQYYRIAAESAQPDQVESKKQALYRAGVISANMRLKRLARRYLDRLYRIDPGYADSSELRASLAPAAV